MEVIERKISLEQFKSREFSYVPYVGMEYNGTKPIFPSHGNWGQYPYDIDLCKCDGYSELKSYFGYSDNATSARVSFHEMVLKYRLFRHILDNAFWYRKVEKGDAETWLTYTPNFGEKFEIDIVDSLDWYDGDGSVIGVYEDGSYANNGGKQMLHFLLKAMGVFIVDAKYIGNNYVPEVMCYSEVDDYRKKLKKMSKNDDCCSVDEYNLYGGGAFYTYLGEKILERETLIDYWNKSLYLIDGEKVSSDVTLDFSLNADFHNIGIYSIIEGSGAIPTGSTKMLKKVETESKLKYLRMDKVSYCERKTEDGVITEELPVVVIDGDEKLKMVNPYQVGRAKNISTGVDKENVVCQYGDVIYSINENKTTMEVTIKYVIGGFIRYNNDSGKWVYDTSSNTGIIYEETYPFHYHDYTKDFERRYPILNYISEVDAFKYGDLMEGAERAVIYDIPDETPTVTATFYLEDDWDMTYDNVIMVDYNFGRSEGIVENVEDVIVDRGYISAFELHYKLGEINTFEDLLNYGNNSFGL